MTSPTPYIIRNDNIRRNCYAEIERMSRINPSVRVRIDEIKVSKSSEQLGYVFGGIYPTIREYLFDKTGNRFDITSIIHPYHVEAFNSEQSESISKSVDIGLGEFTIKRNMSGWKVQVMRDYIDWILRTYADKYALYIESPEEWKAKRGLAA